MHLVWKFIIARSHKFKNEKGDTEEQVMFFEVTLFGQFGEKILQYLNKTKGICTRRIKARSMGI